jgi:hypothetical protein
MFLMVGLLGFVAFATDIGYLLVARAQLQGTADSAALSAAWDLIDEDAVASSSNPYGIGSKARLRAAEYAALNPVIGQTPSLDANDVEVGYLANPSDSAEAINTTGMFPPNAIRVMVRRDEYQNGEIGMFFAKVFNYDKGTASAESTAAIFASFNGFREPSDGSNLGILPFALDEDTWNDLLAGVGDDDWKWDTSSQQATSNWDGVLEINLFPQGTGSPGNRGTVDIGSSNNSTADIARQIVDGVSASDLAYHGGKIELDAGGELSLNGDTGISAGVKDELASIIGEPRIIPIFSQVAGPGNNAQYTIVKFVGVRIMEVKLTGKMSSKRVIVQPATVVTLGGIPNPNNTTSHFIYSPPRIIR